ncbi:MULTISPECIES: DUF6161 domain-containing protein [unclassified Rhizobium]|uniref:DUF6161 domain-containing protein n=1 Tax=unclassified Rhizobium TaxID=2613769 RepID=UPI00177DDFD8|nr:MULTISPECIES: DUF6161 domain-containing protein [unclassified Rhizobium]MBD8689342.1 hypothetical protein [Rhizobium sp. CFBP 13644]MBD8693112.1 hypothetical protein [Rhizobium sp. CFBP 13717]
MNLHELKSVIFEVLNPPKAKFGLEGAKAAALEEAAQQNKLYSVLIATVGSLVESDGVRSVQGVLYSVINSQFPQSFEVVKDNDGYFEIAGPYPQLSQAGIENLLQILHEKTPQLTLAEQVELVGFTLGGLTYLLFKSSPSVARIDLSHHAWLHMGLVAFAALRVETENLLGTSSPIVDMYRRYNSEAHRAIEMADLERKAHEQAQQDLRTKIVEVETTAEKIEDNFKHMSKLFKDHLDTTGSNLSDLFNSSRENMDLVRLDAEQKLLDHSKTIADRLSLRHVTQRWNDVRKRAKRTLWASGFAILLMFMLASTIIAARGHEILEFLMPFDLKTMYLNTTATGVLSMQIARMALIAVPIATYFWLLKIVVRIFMRSLVLMDDADQRATIMDSYYALTGDGMTDERALPMMLWAIFRPLPGHGPDGIDPPDFTEAINAGLKIGAR